jgi:hypothetical protein
MIQSAAWMTLRPARHIAVGIRRSYAEVYAFLSQPENFPKWASGLGHSFHHRAGFEWVAETPLGIMAIRFSEPNEFGVLDHWLLPETGAPMHNPMRAFPAGDGTEVVFSLVQRPELSDEEFARDAEWVAKDLAALKALLDVA